MTTDAKPEHDLEGLRAVLAPRSIAIIGASRQRTKVGGQVFHNLLAYGFNGPVYPVNPTADVIQSVPAYRTIGEVPGPVDLAMIAVPAPEVLAVAAACIAKGVKALGVLSAGFGEAGEAGRERQQALLHLCRQAGVRMVGPNCLGIVNTAPAVHMNALFSPVEPPAGRLAFASQSGALGLAAVAFAAGRGLGFSNFVSMGNKADVSSNDLLAYWDADANTDVVLLYLESFGNPRRFAQLARDISRRKPIVAVKSGRSSAGQRAAASHTGALLAASDITVDALFREAGVVRVDTLNQLFDVAALLGHQPLPGGRNVGIVTNVGGPAIMCADACESHGLRVPELSAQTQAALREFLPAEAGVRNPVDMIATASAGQFERTIAAVAADPGVDALVAIFIPPLTTQPAEVAAAIHRATGALGGSKPVLAVFMSPDAAPPALSDAVMTVPNFPFPEDAALALSRAVDHAEWRRRPHTPPLRPAGIDALAAAAVLAATTPEGWLPAEDCHGLLASYGIPTVEQRTVTLPAEAGQASAALGGPVALKAIAPNLLHKSDAGGVVLGLEGAAAVQAAAETMQARLGKLGYTVEGFVVQRQAAPGVEMLAGVVHDHQFGPLIACGAGGTLVELLGDMTVSLAPVSLAGASDMLQRLRTYPLLTGYRGSPPTNVAALTDLLVRLSHLAADFPQVAEVDCNPIIVSPTGALVVDARVRLAPP